MSGDDFPAFWRDPNYVATLVGVLATLGLFFYSGLVASAPSAETIGFVLLWILVPTMLARNVARRYA